MYGVDTSTWEVVAQFGSDRGQKQKHRDTDTDTDIDTDIDSSSSSSSIIDDDNNNNTGTWPGSSSSSSLGGMAVGRFERPSNVATSSSSFQGLLACH